MLTRLLEKPVKGFFNRLGLEITPYSSTQPGQSAWADMKHVVGQNPMVFDVGANEGQTVETIKVNWPRATIHAFEPGPDAFAVLQRHASRFEGVILNNAAVGSAPGTLPLIENSQSEMSSFLPLGRAGWGRELRRTPVQVVTLDDYCARQGIDSIDVLKCDTQGYELEVFRGAERLMTAGRIRMVYFEVTFNDLYQGLPSLDELWRFLSDRSYRLVSFYHTRYHERLASWTNALFLNVEPPHIDAGK
jgi:FkbM family methyltransferase